MEPLLNRSLITLTGTALKQHHRCYYRSLTTNIVPQNYFETTNKTPFQYGKKQQQQPPPHKLNTAIDHHNTHKTTNLTRWISTIPTTHNRLSPTITQSPHHRTLSTPPSPTPRKPSILTSLPPHHTPGGALNLLRTHYPSPTKIRVSDVHQTLLSTRPNAPVDARVISTLLLRLARYNHFYVDQEMGELAMERMLGSLLEDGGSLGGDGRVVRSGGERRVGAGVWLAGVFVRGGNGLAVSVGTGCLERVVLETVLVGLRDLPEGYVFREDMGVDVEEGGEEDEGGNKKKKKPSTTPSIVSMNEIYTTMYDIMGALFYRSSYPTRKMKKRAKRGYLKRRRCCEGPTARSVDLAVRICLFGEREEGILTARKILGTLEKRPFLGKAEEGTLEVMREAEERLAAVKREEEGEEEVSGGEDESDEGKN